MKFTSIILLLVSILLIQSCCCCYTNGGEDSNYGSIVFPIVLDYGGNVIRQSDILFTKERHSYWDNKQWLNSDNTLMRVIEDRTSYANFEGYWLYYGYNLNSIFYKTLNFDPTLEMKWNELSNNLNNIFIGSTDLFDAVSPYEEGVFCFRRTEMIKNQFRTDSVSSLGNSGTIVQFSNAELTDTIRIVQSGYISEHTFMDTLVYDIKLYDDHSYLLLLGISEYYSSFDSTQTRLSQTFIKQEFAFAQLDNDSRLNILFSKITPSKFDYPDPYISTSDQSILVHHQSNYALFDKQLNLLDDKFFNSDEFIPRLLPKGKGFTLQRDSLFYIRYGNGSVEPLSEILPKPNENVNYAVLYNDQYVIYFSDKSSRITVFDLKSQTTKFSIPTNSSRFNSNPQYYFRRLIPAVVANDDSIQFLIEYGWTEDESDC